MIKVQEGVTLAAANTSVKDASIELRTKILSDVGAKWDRLSEDDMAKVTNSESLSKALVERYGLESGQAHRDVRTFLNGRHF